jgi:tetratricopeptide (TPR) repeat protein
MVVAGAFLAPRGARPQPVPLAPPPASPAARAEAARLEREGMALEQQACQSEDYQPARCAEAAQMLERATQLDGSRTDAQVALAEAQWNRSFEFPKAAPQRRALQDRSSDRLQHLVDAGVPDARPYYQLSLHKTDDAMRRTLLERTLEVAPEHAPAHRDLADVYLRTGDAQKAATTYQRYQVLRRESGVEDARRDVGFAKRLVAQNRPADAQTIYQQAFERTKQEPRAVRCSVFRSVNPDTVSGDLKRDLTGLLPACTNDAGFRRAVDLEHRGQKDEAIRALEAQVQENPQHTESHVMLERLYREKGDTAAAAATVRRYQAVETDPAERCRRFRTDARHREALDPQMRERLARECAR